MLRDFEQQQWQSVTMEKNSSERESEKIIFSLFDVRI